MSSSPQFGFMLENERGWVSSSLFFHSLEKLGIRAEPYYIPPGLVLSPEETGYYIDSIAWKLAEVTRNEYYDYALKVAQMLKSWADRGHIVHIV